MNAEEVHRRRLARREEDARRVIELPFIPAPTVSARPATYEEIASCKSSWDIAVAAAKLGYEPTWRFSKGPLLGADGGVLERDVDALSLRVRRDGALWLVALWRRRAGKTWEFAVAWDTVSAGMQRLTGKQIRPFLKEHAQ